MADDRTEASLRETANWLMSLNLENLDITELQRRANLLDGLAEIRREHPELTARPSVSFTCGDYYCRAVTALW